MARPAASVAVVTASMIGFVEIPAFRFEEVSIRSKFGTGPRFYINRLVGGDILNFFSRQSCKFCRCKSVLAMGGFWGQSLNDLSKFL
jgi:hypothetical protein